MKAIAALRSEDIKAQMDSIRHDNDLYARAQSKKSDRVNTLATALINNINNTGLNVANSIWSAKSLKMFSDELDWKKKQQKQGQEQNEPAIQQTPVFANTFNIPQYDYFGLTPQIDAATPYQVLMMMNKSKSAPRYNIYGAPWNSYK